MRVLVVDDDPHILKLVRFNLEKNHYEVITAEDGVKALQLAREIRPELIILDLMLPEKDGFEVCRELRADADTASIPIIMLTARDQEIDKVLGFELGADDYVTKPFSPRELVARVKAQIRRAGMAANKGNDEGERRIKVGDLVINPARFEVYVRGEPVKLSRKEFLMLHLMASNPGRVFTRDQLMDLIWGYDYSDATRTVDVHVRYLRRKIEPDPSKPRYIETVRGLGYRFKDMRRAGA